MTEAVLSDAIHWSAPPPMASAAEDRQREAAVEQSLVLRSQGGDRAAFEELVRRTAKLVFARIYLEIGRSDGTEDLVQETYLLAWRRVRQVTDADGFRGWLLAIAHTVAVDAARRVNRQKRGGGLSPARRESPDVLVNIATASPGPPELAGQAESRRHVLEVLRSLPDEYRLPLTLRYLHSADYESIARQLGISNGSLRGLLHRGTVMMRREMERAGCDPSK